VVGVLYLGLAPNAVLEMTRGLAAMRGSEDFARLLEGARRCRNILVKEGRLAEEALEGSARAERLREKASQRWEGWRERSQGQPVRGTIAYDPARFEEDAERTLLGVALRLCPELDARREAGDYDAVFAGLSKLGPAIGQYFDSVLVNAPEKGLRGNRLGFLEDIHYLFARFADLSRIPTPET